MLTPSETVALVGRSTGSFVGDVARDGCFGVARWPSVRQKPVTGLGVLTRPKEVNESTQGIRRREYRAKP